MPDPTNDIDALQAQLMKAREDEGWFITGDQAKDFSRALTALVAERDEARREACHLEAVRSSFLGFQKNIKDLAAQRGWDCFKEGGEA